MTMENGRPTKPSDIKNAKFLRFVDPDDPEELIELELIDTGLLTPDGKRRMTLGVTAGPCAASDGPNDETSLALPLTGVLQYLPVTTDARAVWIQNDGVVNSNDILIFGVMRLSPGEQMVIPTDNDASWISFIGTALDVLNYAILRRS